jgi:hypothetical protein
MAMPSIITRLKGGNGLSAATGSRNTRPVAFSKGIVSVPVSRTVSSTAEKASATVSIICIIFV